ncbi:hypothetical protein BC628DRAFT_1417424 [Trametes gibbosa]|nr:hypothetical protein BC628DRAFT_1417424 [Trametes gibbosa]
MDTDIQPLHSTAIAQTTQRTEDSQPTAQDVETNEAPAPAPRRPLLEPEPYEHTLNVIYIFDSDDDPMAYSDYGSSSRTRSVQRYFGEPGCGPIKASTEAPIEAPTMPFGPRKSKRLRDKTTGGTHIRQQPIVISDSEMEVEAEVETEVETSEESGPEDDGVVGPRRPLWVYKVKPAPRATGTTTPHNVGGGLSRVCTPGPRASHRPREVPMENPVGSGPLSMRREGATRPGGCGGLVQRKESRDRAQVPPQQLKRALRSLREEFPYCSIDIGYRNLSDRVVKWGFRCKTCSRNVPLITGSNAAIAASNMRFHLRAKHRPCAHPRAKGHHGIHTPTDPAQKPTSTMAAEHAPVSTSVSRTTTLVQSSQAAHNRGETTCATQTQSGAGSSHSLRSRRASDDKDNMDDVERFLCKIGLAPTLAGALRTLGITDRATMQSWSEVPDARLDRLESRLEDEGLNMTQAMMVRQGLKRYG